MILGGLVCFQYFFKQDSTANVKNGERLLTWHVAYDLNISEKASMQLVPIEIPEMDIKLTDLLLENKTRLNCFDKLAWQTLNRTLHDSVVINIVPKDECVIKIRHNEATSNDLDRFGIPKEDTNEVLSILHEQKSMALIYSELEKVCTSSEAKKILTVAIKKTFI